MLSLRLFCQPLCIMPPRVEINSMSDVVREYVIPGVVFIFLVRYILNTIKQFVAQTRQVQQYESMRDHRSVLMRSRRGLVWHLRPIDSS